MGVACRGTMIRQQWELGHQRRVEDLYTYKDIVPACKKALQKLRKAESHVGLEESALSTSSDDGERDCDGDDEVFGRNDEDEDDSLRKTALPQPLPSDLSDTSTDVVEDDESSAHIPPHDHPPELEAHLAVETPYLYYLKTGSEVTYVEDPAPLLKAI